MTAPISPQQREELLRGVDLDGLRDGIELTLATMEPRSNGYIVAALAKLQLSQPAAPMAEGEIEEIRKRVAGRNLEVPDRDKHPIAWSDCEILLRALADSRAEVGRLTQERDGYRLALTKLVDGPFAQDRPQHGITPALTAVTRDDLVKLLCVSGTPGFPCAYPNCRDPEQCNVENNQASAILAAFPSLLRQSDAISIEVIEKGGDVRK